MSYRGISYGIEQVDYGNGAEPYCYVRRANFVEGRNELLPRGESFFRVGTAHGYHPRSSLLVSLYDRHRRHPYQVFVRDGACLRAYGSVIPTAA